MPRATNINAYLDCKCLETSHGMSHISAYLDPECLEIVHGEV